jgi:hypothetical protein
LRGKPRGQPGIKFNRRHLAAATDKAVQYSRVVPNPGTDMHSVLARLRRGAGDQRRM